MKKNLSTKLRLTQNAVLMDTVKIRLTGLSENEVREQRSQFDKNAITIR